MQTQLHIYAVIQKHADTIKYVMIQTHAEIIKYAVIRTHADRIKNAVIRTHADTIKYTRRTDTIINAAIRTHRHNYKRRDLDTQLKLFIDSIRILNYTIISVILTLMTQFTLGKKMNVAYITYL